MLEVAGLSVAYGPHRALEDVALHVAEGEICVILGANGAGKSTLLKAIAGLLTPLPGAHVGMAGEEFAGRASSRIVEAGIALVPEGRGLFGDLSVAENLELGGYGRQARASRERRLAEVLALFPRLGERRSQIARTMSGGEQQMLAVGRALMSNPRILMLDEPSLGLSPLLCRDLFRALRRIGESGVGVLLVEQNARQSLAIADRAYLLENGRIVGEGRASRMLDDPAVQRAYLGGAAPAGDAMSVAASMPARLPAASVRGPRTTADLAAHAGEIARAHIAAQRSGGPAARGALNGHVSDLSPTNKGEAIIVSSQADELSRRAAEFAAHAARIQAAHVAAARQAALAASAEASSDRKGKAAKKARKKGKSKGKR